MKTQRRPIPAPVPQNRKANQRSWVIRTRLLTIFEMLEDSRRQFSGQ